jgi:acyl-CoA dehydrogenase
MAGGLQAILDLAVDYAKERVAFGRPITNFQAVQHNLARLGGETAAAVAAARSAADAIANAESANAKHFDQVVFLEVTAAKIRTGEAVGQGRTIAHQTFGAIGFSSEHVLQRHTRRLWAWRDDYGSESEWAVRLGKMIATKGADKLWPLIA